MVEGSSVPNQTVVLNLSATLRFPRQHNITREVSVQRFMVVLIGLLGFASGAMAGVEVTVAPDSSATPSPIPADFIGLSFEAKSLARDSQGDHLFSPDNRPLLAMFKTLGVKNLRLGGGSVEAVKPPEEADIDSLYAFAKAADVSVIFTLRLRKQTDMAATATLAKYIMDHYAAQTVCLGLGNEPDGYCAGFEDYRTQYEQMTTAILAAAPEAQFCGPSARTQASAWAAEFAKDPRPAGHVKFITQHAYPGGDALTMNADAGRQRLVNPVMIQRYQAMYDSFVPATIDSKLGFRIEEANSAFHGGAKDVSNTFASALWGLDFLYWWTQHGVQGVNFHTSVRVTTDVGQIPQGYDLFWKSPAGWGVHPLAYAVKAFEVGSHGSCVPVTIVSKDEINLTAYAVTAENGDLYVTLINKENGPDGHDATVLVDAGATRITAAVQRLTSPNGDLAAKTGTTLGDAAIAADGSWTGQWTPVPASPEPGRFKVDLPACSAAVVRCGAGTQ
jgi:hypothetical protein